MDKIEIDINNIDINTIQKLFLILQHMSYKNHICQNNILTIYFQYENNYINIELCDRIVLNNRKSITLYDYKYININDYNHIIDYYIKLNSGIYRFLEEEKINELKIKIEYKFNILNLFELYSEVNKIYNILISSGKIDIIIFILLGRLFYSFDIFENCFIISKQNINEIKQLLNTCITLNVLDNNVSSVIDSTDLHYNYRSSGNHLVRALYNEVLLSNNKYLHSPDINRIKIIDRLILEGKYNYK